MDRIKFAAGIDLIVDVLARYNVLIAKTLVTEEPDGYMAILENGEFIIRWEEREVGVKTIAGDDKVRRHVWVLQQKIVEHNYPNEPDWEDMEDRLVNTSPLDISERLMHIYIKEYIDFLAMKEQEDEITHAEEEAIKIEGDDYSGPLAA